MALDDGGTLATARVKLIADANGMPDQVRSQTEKQLSDAGEKAGSSFGKRMTAAIAASVAVGAAIVGKRLISGLKESIGLASDLNETTSKASVVFGKGAADIEKFASTAATRLGQTKQQALDAATTFAVFGKGANLSGKELVTFSSGLVKTATDMASFSNTTPQEAIESLTAAMRGEFDPIEKYGVLLNQTNVQAEALSLGLLKGSVDVNKVKIAQERAIVAQKKYTEAVKEHGKSSKEALSAHAGLISAEDKLKTATSGSTQQLTSQQRVLAVQSLIMKQTKDAQGDFARTSAGLANQQRILSAQFTNLKTSIGQAFLPVVLKLVTIMTSKVMPTIQELWAKHGPALIKFLDNAANRFGHFVDTINTDKLKQWANDAKDFFSKLRTESGPALEQIRQNIGPAGDTIKNKLVPALQQLRQNSGENLAAGIKVTGIAMQFLADHSGLLVKLLPLLAAAFVATKVAQVGATAAEAISPAIKVAEVIATRQQTKAIRELAASRTIATIATEASTGATAETAAVENVATASKQRGIIASVAQRVATIAGTAATWLAATATTALGVAVRFMTGPIGIAITVIGLIVGAIILLYKHNETARRIINAVWAAIKIAIKATGDWIVNVFWPTVRATIDKLIAGWRHLYDVGKLVFNGIKTYIKLEIDLVVAIFQKLRTFVTQTLPNAFHQGVTGIQNAWNKVQDAAKKPVTFVVNSVINPLIRGFNKVAGIFGVHDVPTIPGFAEGGQIPGTPSTRDNRWAWLRDKAGNVLGRAGLATGEFVVNARDTARALPLLQWINNGMRGGPESARQRLGRPVTDMPGDGSEGWAFAKGGLVGFLDDVWGAISDPLKLIKKPVEAVVNKIPGAGPIRDVLVGMGHSLINGLTHFFDGGGSGKGLIGKAQAFLRAQNGKPYLWASAGPRGYDCSGIVSAVYNILHGKNPYSHTFSTESLPGRYFPKPGLGGPLIAAWAHPGERPASASVGHMMGMVGGLTFESTGSRGVHLGSTTRRPTDFAHIGHYYGGGYVLPRYDKGGWWPDGTLGVNTSGRAEHVTTGPDYQDQTALLVRIAELLEQLAPAVGASVGRVVLGTVPAATGAARMAGKRPR